MQFFHSQLFGDRKQLLSLQSLDMTRADTCSAVHKDLATKKLKRINKRYPQYPIMETGPLIHCYGSSNSYDCSNKHNLI